MSLLFRLKPGARLGSMSAMVIDLPRSPHAQPAATAEEAFDRRLDGLLGLGGLSVSAKLDELERFARLMQTQGAGVEPTRMLFDMAYAKHLLQWARVSPCAPLQQLAEQLHAQYQRAGHWLGLH
ncbi:hypothetical protein [Inhella sp.]|uniref:hypothetical protein n=1 Tax=Inhella sp. TaxID=1921806 RepID=UPI0035B07DA3